MGTGHVMRCLSLAQAWQDMGGTVTLLSRDLPLWLAERMRAEGISLRSLSPGVDDAAETARAAAEADWAVLDGYQFDESFCDHVVSQAGHTLMLDDFGQLQHYTAELVLNQNISASEALYEGRGPRSAFLLGCSHALLRREFRQSPPLEDASARCERVLVTLGGSDPDNVTSKVIGALAMLPDLEAKVIVGAVNPRRGALQQMCLATGGRITVVPPVEQMTPLMDWAQLAVSAGGTSVLELASRGLPTVLIAIADNQTDICRTMHERGIMTSCGWHEDVTTSGLAEVLRQAASEASSAQRRSFRERGMKLVDGRGALRVCREMKGRSAMALVKVRRAAEHDVRPIFEWANDPETRSVSFQQGVIPWDTHQAWFTRKLADPSCRLLVAEDSSGTAFGMVRFDVGGDEAAISINLAPEHRHRGLGTAVLLAACRAWLAEGRTSVVTALVKPGNEASLRAFQRAGFERVQDVDEAGQRAVCMVLR